MFIVNAWVNPDGSRYETSIYDNGKQDIWRISYLFYVIDYGIPTILSPITYVYDSGQLKRMFEAWYGTWNILVMTVFMGSQVFWFWPSDYYLGDYPWEVMFVYVGFYVLHLAIWAVFRNNLYRWAYGVDAIAENLDQEYFDYCCYSYTSGNGPNGQSVRNCAIHHEDPSYGDRVCN